jgi:hypothetical protein
LLAFLLSSLKTIYLILIYYFTWWCSQVVRQKPAKLLSAGSNPAITSFCEFAI